MVITSMPSHNEFHGRYKSIKLGVHVHFLGAGVFLLCSSQYILGFNLSYDMIWEAWFEYECDRYFMIGSI